MSANLTEIILLGKPEELSNIVTGLIEKLPLGGGATKPVSDAIGTVAGTAAGIGGGR